MLSIACFQAQVVKVEVEVVGIFVFSNITTAIIITAIIALNTVPHTNYIQDRLVVAVYNLLLAMYHFHLEFHFKFPPQL